MSDVDVVVDPTTGEIISEDAVVVNRDKPRMPLSDYVLKLMRKLQTIGGDELPSDVPVAPPVGYRREPSMVEHIRAMVRSEHLRIAAEQAGLESFEEADDFDVPDEDEPLSAYEMADDYEPVSEFRRRMERAERDLLSAKREAEAGAPVQGASGPAGPAAAPLEPSLAPRAPSHSAST